MEEEIEALLNKSQAPIRSSMIQMMMKRKINKITNKIKSKSINHITEHLCNKIMKKKIKMNLYGVIKMTKELKRRRINPDKMSDLEEMKTRNNKNWIKVNGTMIKRNPKKIRTKKDQVDKLNLR